MLMAFLITRDWGPFPRFFAPHSNDGHRESNLYIRVRGGKLFIIPHSRISHPNFREFPTDWMAALPYPIPVLTLSFLQTGKSTLILGRA